MQLCETKSLLPKWIDILEVLLNYKKNNKLIYLSKWTTF